MRLHYHDDNTIYTDLSLPVDTVSFSMNAFSVKKQAQDRPMSMWISSIKQLEPVRHLLNPLLLDFMEAAWPSSISMVIPRGSLATFKCLCFCMTARSFMFVPLASNRAVDGHLWPGGCCQTHRDSTKHCHQEPRLLCGHIPD